MPRAVMFAKRLPAVVLTAAMFAAVYTPAAGTPEFARRTMLSCNACHSVGTRLTELGRTYMAGGFLLPALPRTMPAVAVRGQAVYSSDPDPTGLPKAIIDEIDLLSASFTTLRLMRSTVAGSAPDVKRGWNIARANFVPSR